MSKGGWRFLVILGAIVAASIITFGIGVVLEPKCLADSAVWKANGKAEHGDSGAAYSGQVTCNADCQVRFGFAESKPPTGDGASNSEGENDSADQSALPPVEERDLCAQTRVAWWTRLIAFWTAVGAGLLFWTLWETRRDIAETRKIGEAQTRGYVTTKGFRLLASDDDGKPIVEITLENCGSTPVYELRVAAMIEIGPKIGNNSPQRIPMERGKLVIDPFSSATIPGHGTQPVPLKYGRWHHSERASRVASQTTFLHYIGLIYYRDVFDRLWEQDLYYLIFRAAGGEIEARNFTLNAKPRQIQNYPKPKER